MKSETKQVFNIYGIYSEELARMHTLMHAYMKLPQEHNYHGNHVVPREMGVFYKRIVELQNILITALQSHDSLIQEKVAELALTGNANEVKIEETPF